MKCWCRRHRLAVFGWLLLIMIGAAVLLIPLFSPYSYTEQNVLAKNLPGSVHHLFGTDRLGRDLLVRICFGVRISLVVGLGSTLINALIGIGYGGAAGYFGGRTEAVLMRLADVIASIPSMLYVILILLLTEGKITGMVFGLCAAGWISTARMVAGEIRQTKGMEYIAAARLSGVPGGVIFTRYLLPGAAGPIVINLAGLVSQAIFTEAFLSFVGIGISAPLASLGFLIQDARNQIWLYPWQMMYPVMVLCLLIGSVNLIAADLERTGSDEFT